jgi:hypothetical protein
VGTGQHWCKHTSSGVARFPCPLDDNRGERTPWSPSLGPIRYLELSQGSLTGSIPEDFSTLTNLRYALRNLRVPFVGVSQYLITEALSRVGDSYWSETAIGRKQLLAGNSYWLETAIGRGQPLWRVLPHAEPLADPPSLRHLDLDENSLVGTVPEGISALTALRCVCFVAALDMT